jgi:Protein of unknown function (DUF732)
VTPLGLHPRQHGRPDDDIAPRRSLRSTWRLATAAFVVAVGVSAVNVHPAHADAVSYLVNVTVRPGYNFPNADAALTYGRGICEKISHGTPYAQLVEDVKRDFRTADNYQGSYLVAQAAQELCPQLIWQLRRSATDYRG